MEKLHKDLFSDKALESKAKTYAGICATSVGGVATRCCNAAGACWLDLGQ